MTCDARHADVLAEQTCHHRQRPARQRTPRRFSRSKHTVTTALEWTALGIPLPSAPNGDGTPSSVPRCVRVGREYCRASASETAGSMALRNPAIIAACRSMPAGALPAECTPGPSHNERTGTRRTGCRDVLPEPSVGTFTVESKRDRSTGSTRRWTVPECARIPGWGIAPMCRSRMPCGSRGVRKRHADNARVGSAGRVLEALLDTPSSAMRCPSSAPGSTQSRAVWAILEAPLSRARDCKRLPRLAGTASAPNGGSGAGVADSSDLPFTRPIAR